MERHDSLNYARKIGHGLAGAALHEFAGIFGRLPASRDKDFLRGLDHLDLRTDVIGEDGGFHRHVERSERPRPSNQGQGGT